MATKTENLRVVDLRAELAKKGLKTSGRKADLIERLSTGVDKGSSYERKRYQGLPDSDFCGSAGGAQPRSFPVNNAGRCRAALSYARYAPNPEGIRQCALEKAREHPNWRCGIKYGVRSPARRARSASPRARK